MGKRWSWLLILIFVLILSFLLPRFALWIAEKDMEKKVLTYGTGTLLNFDALTLSEKQKLLANSNITMIEEEISANEIDAVREILESEIQLLYNYGGISAEGCSYISDALGSEDIQSKKAYDLNGKNLVYFYSIENDAASVHLDKESGKILSLGVNRNAENIFDATSYDTQLRSWAEYFGMSVSDLTVFSENDSDHIPAVCKLTGSAAVEFYYAIILDPYLNFCSFRSLDPSDLPSE